MEKENNKLKDIVEKLKSDLAERSNLYCWHCGFELKDRCPRCGYGMTDTTYRDTEESNEESDEDNAQWEDKDFEDVDEDENWEKCKKSFLSNQYKKCQPGNMSQWQVINGTLDNEQVILHQNLH